MPISAAPALLVGLGARIFFDNLNRTDATPTLREIILLGVWQGVALQYAGGNTYATIIVGIAIAAKLFLDFSTMPDMTNCISTILGVALGVIGTDLISSLLDQYLGNGSSSSSNHKSLSKKPHANHGSHYHDYYDKRSSRNQREPEPRKQERLVQFRPSVQGGSVTTEPQGPGSTALTSDITSVDSNSGLLSRRTASMTPLEREIAALRARASLADSERRRCREERKWALAQGNQALAQELKANYKRFKALMESCHQEADAKLLEDAKEKELKNNFDTSRQGSSALRDQVARIFLEESRSGQLPSTPQPDRRPRKISTTKVSSRNSNRRTPN